MTHPRRSIANAVLAGLLALGALVFAVLAPALSANAAAPLNRFPERIALPNGFQPEGIAIGGTSLFAGSIPTGAIYQADLRTGQGALLVPPQDGRMALGLAYDSRTNALFVAGGATGSAFVYDAATGDTLGVFPLTTDPVTLVNDVTITRKAVYFTDSFRPVLYRLPLLPGGGLPAATAAQEIPLSGEFDFLPGGLNANGIVATPDGHNLLIDHTDLGRLYRVDPASGQATRLADLPLYPDGMVLVGRTLYVVNFFNHVMVLKLDPAFTQVTPLGVLNDASLDSPATAARFGKALYVVNARFDAPPGPDTPYWVTRLDRVPVQP
jgi:DNA-binding beta-propeller fold protein YncE